jgi:hypothetical protein
MPLWAFRIGDVFDPDDPLAVWACIVAIAFNDLVFANTKVDTAEDEWVRFYEWRIATGHFYEACMHLERSREVPEVQAFLRSEPKVEALHAEVLERYASLKSLTNRVRNQAFHYPYKSGHRAVIRVLRDIANEQGTTGTATTSRKIRDSRQYFADEVVGNLTLNAAGGTTEAFQRAMTDLGEAVAALGRFSNAALDAYFWLHQNALREEPLPTP